METARAHTEATPPQYSRQAHIDHFLREGRPARTRVDRRAQRELSYADYLKIMIEEVREIGD